MKSQLLQNQNNFTPITISITMESQNEVDAMFAVFNSGVIDECLHTVFETGIGDAWRHLDAEKSRDGTTPLDKELKATR